RSWPHREAWAMGTGRDRSSAAFAGKDQEPARRCEIRRAPVAVAGGRDRQSLTGAFALVVVRIVRREPLEAAVDPQILIGHAAYLRFDQLIEAARIGDRVVARKILQHGLDHHAVAPI